MPNSLSYFKPIKAEELLMDYKKKIRTAKSKRKCAWTYFWDGFTHIFIPSGQKWCPHCCSKIMAQEYFDGYVFTYGCSSCREKK